MQTTLRTNSANEGFIHLVALLDADLAQRDSEDHAYYAQFNAIQDLSHAVVIFSNNQAVACGAFKPFDENAVEIKRMYSLPDFRGQGLAVKILKELELWAKELGYSSLVLETGKKQPEAIALYTKYGFSQIENYGQYVGIENSLCFERQIK
jgi:putative acetyltransferase